MWKQLIVLSFIVVAFASHAAGDVVPATLFTDHMVLQRDRDVPVWGKAAPGEQVRVTFRQNFVNTTANADGNCG
jgi:sialate O-acetylesterase